MKISSGDGAKRNKNVWPGGGIKINEDVSSIYDTKRKEMKIFHQFVVLKEMKLFQKMMVLK